MPKSRKRGLVAAIIILGASGWTWLILDTKGGGGGGGDGEVRPTKFTPFTVTSREQVSPTAFILTVRNDQPGQSDINPASVERAWQHGLWSVEIKQPQLQIARHYTPLPPVMHTGGSSSAANEAGGGNDELRFLIRRMDTGEMSNYLARKQAGDQIWLRGPHLGFDVPRRLGAAKQLVFLAGGTGIAPALQAAHRVLDSGSRVESVPEDGDLPTVSILWANRHAVDALGRESMSPSSGSSSSGGSSSWGSWWRGAETATANSNAAHSTSPASPVQASSSTQAPSVSAQIVDMKRRYGSRFQIEYFVDDEKSFIVHDSVARATLAAPGPVATTLEDSARCIWHSAVLLERMSEENDVDRARDPAQSACACSSSSTTPGGAGKNLLFVSGPDGFIRSCAGPKWWHGGLEMQGTVRGLVESMMRSGVLRKDQWLVLKL